jgi:hypothetical protein
LRRPIPHSERGQAAVESAIVLPLLVFMLLGLLQMSIAYHARLLNEYAAFKVARAASVYRLDCTRMTRAGLMALIPSISRVGRFDTNQQRFVAASRAVLQENRPPNSRANIPLVRVEYRVSGPMGRSFDEQLGPNEQPTKVHIRLAYFFEYQIPFANWIISKVWLASQSGRTWATGADPITPVRRTAGLVRRTEEPSPDWQLAEQAIDADYFTVPLVSTWSMRMMSDPLPGKEAHGWCPE